MIDQNQDADSQKSVLMDAAFRLLSFRPRSEKEMTDFLLKRARDNPSGKQIIGQIILYLRESGYLDDRKFVSWFINARSGRAARGNRIIERELIAKGINRNYIRDELGQLDSSEGELNRAAKYIHSCLKKWQSLTGIKRREKICRLLVARGFSYQTALRFIDVYDPKGYNTDTMESAPEAR